MCGIPDALSFLQQNRPGIRAGTKPMDTSTGTLAPIAPPDVLQMPFCTHRLLTLMLCLSLVFIHTGASGQTHVLTPASLQQAGALIEPVNKQQLLCVIRLEDTSPAIWLLMGPGERTKQLGSSLAQLPHVRYLAASPNKAWLAVLSEGEKQKVLEIVDLPALLKNGRYIVLQQISPQRGTVFIRGWAGKKLIIASNAPLALQATGREPLQADRLFHGLHQFAVTIDTGRIEEIHKPTSRKPDTPSD